MDGSNMAPVATTPTKWDRAASVGRWFKQDFAEWVVGSWALIIGWFIFITIFWNFLQMDGFFSRGLGEGSGVNPDLFQNIGWMFRLFAAVFLTLATKFATKEMKGQSLKLKIIGGFCTAIVIAHAMGFGLKALTGKYSNAVSVEQVATQADRSNADIIAELKDQRAGIEAARDTEVAALQSSIDNITGDGLDNDDLADAYRADQTAARDAARGQVADINQRISDLTVSGGAARTQAAQDIAKAEPWPPLYVGLAQLFTQSETPTDGQIFFWGVVFLMCWILLGDAICIFLPPALYALHLKDAKPRKVNLDPNIFADLQAQADELARRKAKLGEGAEKGVKTKTKNKKVRLAIEDMRAEIVKREEILKAAEADAAADQSDELELTEEVPADDSEAPPVENDDAPDEQEKAA